MDIPANGLVTPDGLPPGSNTFATTGSPAGERIIYVPVRREMCLKELGKAGFYEQSFADVGLGSRCSCSRD